jgi:uncharacterized protein YhdP
MSPVANLTFKEQALGAAKFRLDSAADALVIDNIQGQLAGLKLLPGTGLTWSESSQGRWVTDLSVQAEMADFQRTFSDLSLEPLVTTKSGVIQADLTWPGGPYRFEPSGFNWIFEDGFNRRVFLASFIGGNRGCPFIQFIKFGGTVWSRRRDSNF